MDCFVNGVDEEFVEQNLYRKYVLRKENWLLFWINLFLKMKKQNCELLLELTTNFPSFEVGSSKFIFFLNFQKIYN